MTAFNRKNTRSAVFSPIKTKSTATVRTYNGAPGFERDPKADLFLLAAGSFFGQDAFYESGNDAADRFRALVAVNTGQDPAWTARFLAWLRGEGNIRTGAIVGAVEYARTLQEITKAAGEPAPLHEDITARAVVRSVLQRADEPGEMLAYYTSRYGRSIPVAIKRGIADAIVGHKTQRPLYSEYTALKYDTASHGFRFADVLELTHPTGEHPAVKGTKTATLFQWLVDRRHNRVDYIPLDLEMVAANKNLRERAFKASNLADSELLKSAGFTWEDALSLAGDRVSKKELWEALIPQMGYMARLRNLRNFDQAGVSDAVALKLAAELADPEAVAKSRQLPMRYLSAYRAAPSLRWGYALETALDLSLQNVPELKGRTLILVDTSSSMDAGFSKDGTLMRWDAAALFALALARRCQTPDVVSFSSAQRYWGDRPGARTREFPLTRGGSLLSDLRKWKEGGWFLGGGTDTAGAVEQHYAGHDRVVILTDEQATYTGRGDVTAAVPQDRMVYTFNLAGYSRGHAPSGSGTRHTFGGLTDAGFRMINLIERGRNADWPWS